MLRVECEVRVGSFTASVSPTVQGRKLLALVGELGMGGAGGRCLVEVAEPALAPPAAGDPVKVSLGNGSGTRAVFTGEVLRVARTATALRIAAADGLSRLATLDVEALYENTTAGAVVKDLLGQAGVTAGTVEDGPTLATWVVHRGPRALRHLERLADLCGADLFTDGEGKAHFVTGATQGKQHAFEYGRDLLALELREAPPAFDSGTVWGEGAASACGAGKEHWLVTDLASVSGKAALGQAGAVTPGQEGQRPVQWVEGAVRSGEAARAVAEARVAAVARPLRGFLEVLGAPEVEPGDLVELKGLPGASAPRAPLRARRVRHELDARRGFVTRVDF